MTWSSMGHMYPMEVSMGYMHPMEISMGYVYPMNVHGIHVSHGYPWSIIPCNTMCTWPSWGRVGVRFLDIPGTIWGALLGEYQGPHGAPGVDPSTFFGQVLVDRGITREPSRESPRAPERPPGALSGPEKMKNKKHEGGGCGGGGGGGGSHFRRGGCPNSAHPVLRV